MHDESGSTLIDSNHSEDVEGDKGEPILVSWDANDPEDPFQWSSSRKWTSIGIAYAFSVLTAANAAGYASTFGSLLPSLHTTSFNALLANAALLWTCAFAPLALAPISEEFGRWPMLFFSGILHVICFLPQALAKNIWLVILFRALQGIAASGANSLVGGLVADCFRAKDRGYPMSIFALIIFCGQGAGAMCFAFADSALGFRWVMWIQMIVNACVLALIFFFMKETRGSVLLQRRARRLTKETGKLHLASTSLVQTATLWTKLRLSITRPVIFLCTEPAVMVIALWSGTVWAEVFLFYPAVGLFYARYDFTTVQTGAVFSTFIIGGILGAAFANWVDHRYYARDAQKRPLGIARPEARLYATCVGGIVVPVSLFWFAWTAQPNIHWICSAIALVFFNFGCYPIYLAAFSYLGDSYEMWASSAIAAQSLLRNLFSGSMPLIVPIMFQNLSYPIAGTVLAVLTLVFAPIPFILLKYGARIRVKGPVAREIAQTQAEMAQKMEQALQAATTEPKV